MKLRKGEYNLGCFRKLDNLDPSLNRIQNTTVVCFNMEEYEKYQRISSCQDSDTSFLMNHPKDHEHP